MLAIQTTTGSLLINLYLNLYLIKIDNYLIDAYCLALEAKY